MIEAVFAGEFDLLKGCVVKAHVPEYLEYNEIALAAYMLPDGVQKSDSDISVFKYHLSWNMAESEHRNIQQINENHLSELVDLYKYTGEEWKLIQEACVLSVSSRGDTLYFQGPYVDLNSACTVFAYQTHNDIQFKKLKDDFYSFYTINEGESIGINFKNNVTSDSKQKKNLEEFLRKFEDRRLFESSIRMSAVSDAESCKVSENDQEMVVKKPNQDADKEDNLKQQIKVEEEFLFYTLIRNKRDSSIKRGCLTRALAIASSRNDILYYFEPVLKYFLEIYIEFPIIEDDILPVQKLLSDMFSQINSLTNIPPHILYTPKTKFIHSSDILSQFEQPESEILEIQLNDHFQFSISHCNRYETNASLVDLFNRFGQNIMKIWLGLLKELRVLFIGYDRSVRECVNAATAAALLITPFNAQKRLQMYCHLQDLSFTEQQGYIAAVSNPLFENRDSWWDLCCNLSDGSIRESEKVNVMDRLYEKRVSTVDEEFYKEARRIIDEKKKNQSGSRHNRNDSCNTLDDSEWTLRELFRNYTKCTVDMLVNSANLVDFRNEDKPLYEGFRKRKERFGKTTMWKWLKEEDEEERCRFKQLFGGPASAVLFESLLIVKDTRILNDLELITLYSAIATHAKTAPQLALILRYLFARKNSLDVLGIGLFSKSSEVVKQNFKLLTLFETFPIGKSLLKSLSFIMLYTYENFKSKIDLSV